MASGPPRICPWVQGLSREAIVLPLRPGPSRGHAQIQRLRTTTELKGGSRPQTRVAPKKAGKGVFSPLFTVEGTAQGHAAGEWQGVSSGEHEAGHQEQVALGLPLPQQLHTCPSLGPGLISKQE